MPSTTYVNVLLQDAAEIDAAIADGTAKIYATPYEMFEAWDCEDECLDSVGWDSQK
ncbi:MAG: hypothetical protein FWG38_08165 [Defluviitaleaceae bacterium]|nr:hypothetical protein [Defluviitaleaceae bacterium]